MKKLITLGLVLLSIAASVRSTMAQLNDRTAVGGVVLPATNLFILALLALFVLWLAFLLYRKHGEVFRFFTPLSLR